MELNLLKSGLLKMYSEKEATYKYQEIILNCTEAVKTRNGTTLRSEVPNMAVFEQAPIITCRPVAWKQALYEWEWFMSGSTNIKDLHDSVKHWWEPFVNEIGELVNGYGNQFRNFSGIDREVCIYDDASIDLDQIDHIIKLIEENPTSRRIVLSVWNGSEMLNASLPCCHNTATQFFVRNDGTLDLQTYQRSCDVMLGLPHNWFQMWAFLQWIAHLTGKKGGKLILVGGDVHIYEDHYNSAQTVASYSLDSCQNSPNLIYNPTSEEFKADDFTLSEKIIPRSKTKLKMMV